MLLRVDSSQVQVFRSLRPLVVAAAWLAGACWVAHGARADPLTIPDTQLEPVEWADLGGWPADDHAAAFATFRTSCKPLLAMARPHDSRPIYDGLLLACRRAAATKTAGGAAARRFFEENFRPVRIAGLGRMTGLLQRRDRAKPQAEKAQADKVPIAKSKKAKEFGKTSHTG